MSNLRNGHRERRLKREHRRLCQSARLPCWICGEAIDYSAPPQSRDAFESDHVHPVKTHPHLAYMASNLRPSHSSCNRSRGAAPVDTATTGQWVRADW